MENIKEEASGYLDGIEGSTIPESSGKPYREGYAKAANDNRKFRKGYMITGMIGSAASPILSSQSMYF